jgi:Rab family protein
MNELREHAETDIVIMLVGNKRDLVEKNPNLRRVSQNIASQFAAQNGLLFEETSAITSTRVRESFEILLQKIYNERSRVDRDVENVGNRLVLGKIPTERKCCN